MTASDPGRRALLERLTNIEDCGAGWVTETQLSALCRFAKTIAGPLDICDSSGELGEALGRLTERLVTP